MAVGTPQNDHREKRRDRRHARGNTLIAAGASIVAALIALTGTLATIYFSPRDIAERLAPNAASTSTVTVTATHTVTQTPGPTTTTPPPAGGDHLARMEPTDYKGSARQGTFSINGTPYTQSVALEVSSSSYTAFREYTLDGTYRKFTATLGISDELATDATLEFVVSGNGKVLHRQTVEYTEAAEVSLDVTGMVKLRVEATRVSGDPDRHPWGAVFGGAALAR